MLIKYFLLEGREGSGNKVAQLLSNCLKFQSKGDSWKIQITCKIEIE